MAAPLYVEARGAGDPVLLLHGWGMNLRVFDALADGLVSSHRVLAVDLAGHGRSPWQPPVDAADHGFDTQVRWLESLLPARAVVLGWSLGGQYALALARRAPDKVRGLVLVSSTPRFVKAQDWEAGLAPAMLETFASQLARDWHGTLEEFLALQVRGSREGAAVLESLHAALREHGEPRPEALSLGLRQLRDNDLREEVPHIHVPALVIAGQHDRVTPPSAAHWLAGALPRGRGLELPRAGHAPFLSHPVETLDALREYLRGLPA